MVNDELPAGRVTELSQTTEDAASPTHVEPTNESTPNGAAEYSGATATAPISLKDDPNVLLAGAVGVSVVFALVIVWLSGASLQDFAKKLGFLFACMVFFYAACALVQMTVTRPKTRYVIIGSFATFAFLIGLTGLLFLAVPNSAQNPANQQQSGILLLVIAGVTFVPMIKRVRLLLGRVTPVDPNSTVDISAVIVSLWYIVVFGTALFFVDLEAVASEINLNISDSLLYAIAEPLIAFSLVGIWITRTPQEAMKRLGLERPTLWQVGASIGLVVPLLIFGVGLDALGRRLQPDLYAQLERVLEAMSSNVSNPFIALVLGFSAGIGEEILFRGAIQPRLGIFFTAFLFTLAHTQYGITYGAIAVILIGIILGYQRKYMNTTACIITHGTYNTVAFLAPLLSGSGG